MATTAAIFAALGAVGSLGGAAGSIIGGSKGAPAPHARTVPLSPYAQALQRVTARYLAENLTAQPPSFSDYLKSGGTATFGKSVGLNPTEEAQLGVVGKYGNAVPFFDPTTGKIMMGPALTPEQSMFLAQAYQEMGRPIKARRTMRAEKKREGGATSKTPPKKSGGGY